ncbi:hypothetical protein [Rhodococcus globerulus]|uniref:hypothetical protein n=1 Tax=Rhodococcus globerulus TaxID=33008 RepID=UPI00294B153B|nr:hypothetical protein [Rhodococcus globerulus]
MSAHLFRVMTANNFRCNSFPDTIAIRSEETMTQELESAEGAPVTSPWLLPRGLIVLLELTRSEPPH